MNKPFVVAFLTSIVIAFTSGYYVGKISWAHMYLSRVEQQAFSDKVYASLLALYERDPLLEQEESKDVDVGSDTGREALAEKEVPVDVYYAELIGFKTLRLANEYVDKLSQQDIPVRVVKHIAKKTGKKKRDVVWFQVITDDMERQALEEIVEGLQKHDKLTGVKIKRRESRNKERLTS